MSYETVIGLEIHVQLATRSKLFCADDAAFGGAPNSHVSPISLAHPGTLPRLNRRAVEFAVQLGLALGCEISRYSAFDRKNYFYADLPKGYQITQDRYPICVGGIINYGTRETVDGRRLTEDGTRETVDGTRDTVDEGRYTADGTRLTVHGRRDTMDEAGKHGRPKADQQPSTVYRQPCTVHHIHLEEDAGKSLHDQDPQDSLIDLNRAGVPLLEIVTEPDQRSAAEASACLEAIRRLVRWLGVSDGNMEEGSLRCDVNVSVRPLGEPRLGTRCEVKNVNSFRFVRRAIEHEAARQIAILEKGGRIEQETRGFDAATGTTYSLREKEQAHDYRYFPEPDLPPIVLTDRDLDNIRAAMPMLPDELENLFLEKFSLPAADAALLTQERDTAFYFLALTEKQPAAPPRALANLLIQKIKPWAEASGKNIGEFPLSAAQIGAYLELIETGQIGASAAAQRLLPALLDHPEASAAVLAAELNLLQIADTGFLDQLADTVLARFPDKVAEYRKGKKGLIGFFMGELMKASGGRAEPGAATRVLQEKLG